MDVLVAFLFVGALSNWGAKWWRARNHKKIILMITPDMRQDEREMLYYAASVIQRAICIDRITTTIWFMMAIFMAVANYFWGQAGMNG